MATQKPTLSGFLTGFLASLLSEQGAAARARLVSAQVAEFFPGCGVAVYRLLAEERCWALLAMSGEIHAEDSVPLGEGTLAQVAEAHAPTIFAGSEIRREDFAHLGVRRTVASLAYVPLARNGVTIGVLELVSFDRALRDSDLAVLDGLDGYAAVALSTALAYESERNTHYDSINRLTQLYDLERTFNSTLEMGKLLPIISSKVRDILNVQAVNLWMVHDDDLLLASRDGSDPTTLVGELQKTGEGIAAEVSEKGEAVRLVDPSDPRLVKRCAGAQPPPITSVMAVPVVAQGFQVAVLEAVNRTDRRPFTEDDLFFLDTISQTAASALHNASLLEAERKIEILQTLVEVSQEITATLNLDRVLQVLVNAPQRIIEYERAAVALEQKHKIVVKAVSGKTEVVQSDPAVKALSEMVEWAHALDASQYVTTSATGQVIADREETRAKFFGYFKNTGFRSWYSVPLGDEQGRLGTLVLESRKNDFLSEAHFELIKILAAQATVALRNASLYTEVPFIGVLEPILHKRQQFQRMDAPRRRAVFALAAALALFLVVVPLPMRVEGNARVAPQRSALVQAEEDGVVRNVYVREGDPVKKGTVLADMEDWSFQAAVAAAEARRDAALAAMDRALANNDGAEAGVQRVQSELWKAEVLRARDRLEHRRMRSPIDGVIATAHVENMIGRKLAAGDTFAQVVDTAHASVDVQVDQSDLPLVGAGDSAVLKLVGFPTHRFQGQVTIVSPASGVEGDKRVFYARVDVPNPEGQIRAGMEGQAKVFAGWRPAGYVMFRGAGMWVWTRVWRWFGW